MIQFKLLDHNDSIIMHARTTLCEVEKCEI